MLTEDQIKTLRGSLESEATRLRSELDELGQGDAADLQFDANFADNSQVSAERGEIDTLADTLRDGLIHVEEALGRIEEGTYGFCTECGDEIDFVRLEARPKHVAAFRAHRNNNADEVGPPWILSKKTSNGNAKSAFSLLRR